jgi:hypothetical protein
MLISSPFRGVGGYRHAPNIAPISVSDITLYKPLIKIWRQLFCSNKLCVAMAPKVHTPARKPAVAPQAQSVFGSAKNAARLAEEISANKAVKPNILTLLPLFISSWVSLLSTIQAVPNTFGLYQIPPTKKADNAATKSAGQLITAGFRIVKSLAP